MAFAMQGADKDPALSPGITDSQIEPDAGAIAMASRLAQLFDINRGQCLSIATVLSHACPRCGNPLW
jgi:hypothetical protein